MKLILFLFLFLSTTGHTQVIDPGSDDPMLNLGKKVTWFEDNSTVRSLQEVQEAYAKGQFKNGLTDILNFGNTSSAIWIRIPFRPGIKETDYLIVDAATLEKIDCYQPSDTGWIHLQAGAVIRASPGVQSTNHFVFPVFSTAADATVKTLWLRIKTRNIMLVPLKMAGAGNLFQVEKSSYRIIETGLIGIFFTLLAFNLFLFFGLGDRSYLYYCLYVFSFGCYVLGYFAGYGYLLGPEVRILLNKYPHVFLCLALVSSLLITNKVYDLQKISPVFFRMFKYLFAATGALLIISLLGLKSVAAGGAQLLGLLVPLVLLICGISIQRNRKHPTRYFTLAWLAIILAVIIYVLSLQGVLEYRPYSRLILETGAIIEFLLLAFVLGQRYHLILENQRAIQEENYRLIKDRNLQLEQLVEKRTEKLKEAIAGLEASDNVKNKLFSIIAHDLRTPFNSMLGIFSIDSPEALSLDELQLILNENKKSFFHLRNLLDNLLHWARTQMNEVQLRPEVFNLVEIVQDLAAVYQPVAQAKQLHLEIKTEKSAMVYADKNHIQLVLRNLLDNAVKFTQPGHTIYAAIGTTDTGVRFELSNEITDTTALAAALRPAALQYRSSYGTANEKGVGLGLNLCRDYLELNGSSLAATVTGTNVSFGFLLPYPPARPG
ncbi:sensor histidine kinase [Niabella beijingensis]|uniref:sensor histidine kinase n=1 Tax=Niabella beijingensis TaxID=2872700 RepID=UPI001CBABDB7|nr:sensor histidine kinase [Niabella beijingensis]MBZ4191956.1 sensor histidine kinase [Niabella beijingensis]